MTDQKISPEIARIVADIKEPSPEAKAEAAAFNERIDEKIKQDRVTKGGVRIPAHIDIKKLPLHKGKIKVNAAGRVLNRNGKPTQYKFTPDKPNENPVG